MLNKCCYFEQPVHPIILRKTYYSLHRYIDYILILYTSSKLARNGSIPGFIYGTSKWFYRTIFFGKRFYWYRTPGFYI